MMTHRSGMKWNNVMTVTHSMMKSHGMDPCRGLGMGRCSRLALAPGMDPCKGLDKQALNRTTCMDRNTMDLDR